VQLANAAASIEQAKVLPASVAVNEKLALELFDGLAGLAVIVVSGAAVSTVQVKLAGDASALPAASVAATVNVWLPSASPAYVFGLVQLAAAPPSIVQLNVLPASVEVKEKLALALFVGFVGLVVIVVFGAVVSTVKATDDEPTFVAASVALTTTVCEPSVNPLYAFGLVQLVAAPPSMAQVVVYGATPPETEKTTLGLAVLMVEPLAGELIVTVGAVRLTFHV
jgi:hypothetical protein